MAAFATLEIIALWILISQKKEAIKLPCHDEQCRNTVR